MRHVKLFESFINENFPGVGEVVDIKNIDNEMKDYFNRTNKVLAITTKDKKSHEGTVTKFYNDLIFVSKDAWDIPLKDILSVKILESDVTAFQALLNEAILGKKTPESLEGKELISDADIQAKHRDTRKGNITIKKGEEFKLIKARFENEPNRGLISYKGEEYTISPDYMMNVASLKK